MVNRQGGTLKPLKAKKKAPTEDELEDRRAAKERERDEAKAKAELLGKAKGKGPLNTGSQGIKKSGKK